MISSQLVRSCDLERETGFGSDLLRKWRSRYGFPNPVGQIKGDPAYHREQIAQLKVIRRLQDVGFRPAQIVGKSLAELDRLATASEGAECDLPWTPFTCRVIDLIKAHDLAGLEAALVNQRAACSLSDFVADFVAPLSVALGEAWARGEIKTYQEHLCTQFLMRALYAELPSLKVVAGSPRILFATPTEELHVLGLLMAQLMLADRGADCIGVGAHIPIQDLADATMHCQADILALSFSASYPKRRVRPLLVQLRGLLPSSVDLWIGGAGASMIRRPPRGVRVFPDLRQAVEALDTWKARA